MSLPNLVGVSPSARCSRSWSASSTPLVCVDMDAFGPESSYW